MAKAIPCRPRAKKKKLSLLFRLFRRFTPLVLLLLPLLFFIRSKEPALTTLSFPVEDAVLPSDTASYSPGNNRTEWNLLLVNHNTPLPEGFTLELTRLRNDHAIDRRAYPDLQEMMDDMRAQGLSPLICSSYRSAANQQKLFDDQVAKHQA